MIISETEVNEILPVVNILPITSRKQNRRIYPNEALIGANYGLSNESIILSFQIRTLDKSRLSRYLGTVNNELHKNEIIESLKFQIGIE